MLSFALRATLYMGEQAFRLCFGLTTSTFRGTQWFPLCLGLVASTCRDSQVWPTALDLRSSPLGVRRFESGSLHILPYRVYYRRETEATRGLRSRLCSRIRFPASYSFFAHGIVERGRWEEACLPPTPINQLYRLPEEDLEGGTTKGRSYESIPVLYPFSRRMNDT